MKEKIEPSDAYEKSKKARVLKRLSLLSRAGGSLLAFLSGPVLSATTLSIDLRGDSVSRSFSPKATYKFDDGTEYVVPSATLDSIEFVSNSAEFDLTGVSEIEFWLRLDPGKRLFADTSRGIYRFGFGLNFLSTNVDLALTNIETSLLGPSEKMNVRTFLLTSSLGPASEFQIPGSSEEQFPESFFFDGLLVRADIPSPLTDGTLSMNTATLGFTGSGIPGGSDSPSALLIVPEPTSGMLSLSGVVFLLMSRRRNNRPMHGTTTTPAKAKSFNQGFPS